MIPKPLAEIAVASNKVPIHPESAKEPPTIRPTMPEIETLPKATPTWLHIKQVD